MPADYIMIRVRADLKNLIAPINNLLSLAESQLEATRGGKSVDYARVEKEVAHATGEIERQTHGILLKSLDTDAKHIKYQGHEWYRVASQVDQEFATRTGAIIVARSLFRKVGEHNGTVLDTVSIRAGVVGGRWLPNVAKEMAFEIQKGSSREAEQTARIHGILPYSRASFERVGHAVGEHYIQAQATIEDVLMEQSDIPLGAVGVSISIDRASIPMEEPAPQVKTPPKPGDRVPKVVRAFRMAYCGSLSFFDNDGESLRTIRYGLMPGNDPVAGLCDLMRSDVASILRKNPSLLLHRIGDGAPEVWNLLDKVPECTGKKSDCDLIDFMHLIGKVGSAAREVFGESEGSRKVDTWAHTLKRDGKAVEDIHDELMLSGHRTVNEPEGPVHDALTYIENNSEKMNYADAVSRGLPIGSGIVEATVKSLIEGRMKKPGARWKIRSGDHVLQMRALAHSDRWDDAIDLALKPLRGSIRIFLN